MTQARLICRKFSPFAYCCCCGVVLVVAAGEPRIHTREIVERGSELCSVCVSEVAPAHAGLNLIGDLQFCEVRYWVRYQSERNGY